ncbi:hypothetical protein BU17DRAFT_94692 [Hysterangium stoloniferum]|nr:hypothetical protein BU17DRAFT_94692 [Hysterangium stoloniferum]
MSPPPAPFDAPTRRRTTRACDQCRKTKSRCEHPPQSEEPCRNCVLSGTGDNLLYALLIVAHYVFPQECTFLEPSHKRGPPKGLGIFIIYWTWTNSPGAQRYLSALEQRLHDAEALLGVIISSHDPRATTMILDLQKDSLAAAIIARVANSSFGPVGRNALQHRDNNTNPRRRSVDLRHQQISEQEAPMIDSNGHLVFTAPSHTWQDYLNLRLSLESRFRTQGSSKSYDQSPASPSDHNHLAPKLPELDTAFHFPISSTVDATHMTLDACVVASPTSNSEQMTGSLETPEPKEIDEIAQTPSTNRSDSTLVDMGAPPSHEETNDYAKNPYSRDYLNGSLGLDTGFSAMLDQPFGTSGMSESPLELNKPRARWSKDGDDADSTSWTRLVVEESEPPSLFDGGRVSSSLELHELVGPRDLWWLQTQ